MARAILVPLVIILLACAAGAGLPHAQTLHDRVLESSVILIARLSPADESEGQGDAPYKLDVIEVLAPENGLTDTTRLRLDNSIPSISVIGARHETPTDVDVVVFAHLFGDRLFLLSRCTNSIVALRDRFEELPGPQYERRELTRDEFIEHLRRQIEHMRNFDYLVKAHRGARGSMHPFSAHDRPALLGRLLALSDKRVPAFARKLLAEGVSTRERLVLLSYFAREPDGAGLPVLRKRFDDLFRRWKAGELAGVEDYDFGGWSRENRPRDERLLDVARLLLEAGDAETVTHHLLPAFREGFTRAGGVLLRAGNEEVLRTLVERARSWTGEMRRLRPASEAAAVLIESRERSCVLAVVRLALARRSVDEARGMLEAVRREGLGPGVSFEPGWMSVKQQPKVLAKLRGAWREWWRRNASRLPSVYPPKSLEEILGADPGWRTAERHEEDR